MRLIRVSGVVAALSVVAACHRSSSGGSAGGTMAAPALPAGVTAQLIAQGDSLYNTPTPAGQPTGCARCHGPMGAGGPNGPNLTTGAWLHGGRDFANLVRIITNGMPRDSIKDPARRFPMNPRGGPLNLNEAQARAMAAYVWSISANKTQ